MNYLYINTDRFLQNIRDTNHGKIAIFPPFFFLGGGVKIWSWQV